MNTTEILKKDDIVLQSKSDASPTPEELAALTKLYEQASPQNKNQEIVKAKVIDIGTKDIVLDLGLKADGVVSSTEFRDLPNLKIGDEVEVYVEALENQQGELVVSREKAGLLRTWQLIQDSLDKETSLECFIKRKTKGGLIVDLQGIEAFLPGSQIDTSPVTDYDAYIGKKLDVCVLKINYAKNNVIVSHRFLIKKELEEQKRVIISNLQEGQILEGTVSNITKFGAFINLGGITGLVHIKEMSWNKHINHPDLVKDDEGNLMFERDKKVKVVVIGFDKEKNHISLSTKAFFDNPWDNLSDKVQEGSILQGKVAKLIDCGAFIEIKKGIEAFIYISDISLSSYIAHPEEVLEVGQEIDVIVLAIDSEKQDLRVGRKQLMDDPWEADDFLAKYAMDTRQKAKVCRFTESGTYLELAPGIEGFLHNRHLSWIKKTLHASDILKKGEIQEVLILSADEPNKLLELGFRELEDSPWDTFETTFTIGSIHKSTLLKKLNKGFIVELPYGLECFVFNKELVKKDKSNIAVGDVLDFMVVEFIKHEQKVLLSHTATFKKNRPTAKTSNNTPTNFIAEQKTTLGDFISLDKQEAPQTDKK